MEKSRDEPSADFSREIRVENESPTSSTNVGPNEPAISEYIDGKVYWKTTKFIGSFWAIAIGNLACYAGFAMPANTLGLINEAIGPSESINWVALVWTLTVSVGYTLVGRLSDIFGRRYFFITGAILGLLGSIIAATAKNVDTLIGATVLLGLAASTQISFTYVTGELVPVRHRFIVNGLINAVNIPVAVFGPLIARAFILNTSASWRWNYYFCIIMNAISLTFWCLFYSPPSFGALHQKESKWDEIKSLDYVGIILFTGGLLLSLMGLSWGGGQYPWNSAHTIATLVVGFAALIAFILYEAFSGVRVPLVPMHVFRNIQYDIIVVLTTVGGMIYYSMTVIYPTVLTALYPSSTMQIGLLSCAVGGGTCAGQIFGGLLAMRIGHLKSQMIVAALMMMVFIGGLAAQTPSTKALSSAFAVLGCFGVGYIEIMCGTVATFVIDDQKQMGTPNGIFGSIRSAGGVLATTIYLAIMRSRLTVDTKTIVIPALLKAGLPTTSLENFLVALNSGVAESLAAIPGATQEVIEAGAVALTKSYVDAFQKVFYASIAFGGCAVLAACLVRPISKQVLSGGIVFHLEEEKGSDIRQGGEEDVEAQNHEASLEKEVRDEKLVSK